MEDTLPAPQAQRHREAEMVGVIASGRAVALQLGDEGVKSRIGAVHCLAAQALDDVPPPLPKGLDARLLRDVWAPNGAQVLVDPPQDVRDAAERLQFPPPSLEVRGYEALAARVARAYEMFVAPGEHVFRRGGDVLRLRSNVLGVAWEMVTTTGGDVVGGGFDVLRLDADGRVRTDYQFIGA